MLTRKSKNILATLLLGMAVAAFVLSACSAEATQSSVRTLLSNPVIAEYGVKANGDVQVTLMSTQNISGFYKATVDGAAFTCYVPAEALTRLVCAGALDAATAREMRLQIFTDDSASALVYENSFSFVPSGQAVPWSVTVTDAYPSPKPAITSVAPSNPYPYPNP